MPGHVLVQVEPDRTCLLRTPIIDDPCSRLRLKKIWQGFSWSTYCRQESAAAFRYQGALWQQKVPNQRSLKDKLVLSHVCTDCDAPQPLTSTQTILRKPDYIFLPIPKPYILHQPVIKVGVKIYCNRIYATYSLLDCSF